MIDPRRLAVMVVTDPACGPGRDVASVVAAALAGGATAVQLRMKEGSTREMVQLGSRLRELTREAGALLLVNDRVDVALVVGADGAHLGDDDLPLLAARSVVPPGFVLGRSVDSPEEAARAAREGADYVGAGPVVGTPSKADAGAAIGLEGIGAVRAAVRLPVVAIGGVGRSNARAVARAGADGVAVIRAVMQAEDPAEAARWLAAEVAEGRREGV